MLIVDVHAHIFHNKIAQKASAGIGAFYEEHPFDADMRHDGTICSLLNSGKKAGINKYVVHSVATTPAQVSAINNFISESVSENKEFIGFGSFHHEIENVEQETNKMFELGLHGVKLHPDFQKFNFDSEQMYNFYSMIQGKLPLLVHTGDPRYTFSHPARIANVLDMFPNLDIICAHFGGYHVWSEGLKYLAGRRVWVDTSSSLMYMTSDDAIKMINAFGIERVIYGTDYPMWDASEELERLYKLNLSSQQLELILNKNICNLLNLSI